MIGRLAIAGLLFALTVPASAQAVWTETSSLAMQGGGVMSCMRPVAPGLMSALGPLGRRTTATDLLRVGAGTSGFDLAERKRLGYLVDCAAVASNGSGTTVYAGEVVVRNRTVVRVTVSSPGGVTTTTDLATPSVSPLSALVTAVSPRGDVLVAWGQRTGGFRSKHARTHVSAARLLPGGRFSPVEVVSPWRPGGGFGNTVQIAAAVDGAGRATLAWGRSIPDRGRFGDLSTVESRGAEAGRPFGPVQVLAAGVQSFRGVRPALAVNPDGAALVAFEGSQVVSVLERPAGLQPFAPRASFVPRGFVDYQRPVIALRPDGAAVVAWRSDPGDEEGGVHAATRTGPGSFAAPITIKGPRNLDSSSAIFGLDLTPRPSAPTDEEGRELRVVLSRDGRVVLTWVALLDAPDGDVLLRPRVALASLGDKRFSVQTLGTPCRSVNGATPIVTADGLVGVAWTDNATEGELGAGTVEFPTAGGRIHLAALAPSAGARAPAPRVAVRARPQRLHYSQPLRLSVRCNGPCYLRAVIRARRKADRVPGDVVAPEPDEPHAFGTAGLVRAGTTRLDVGPSVREHIARRAGGRVRVAVHACQPASGALTRRVVRVPVSRKPLPPLRAPVQVRARRSGSRVVVRWRTTGTGPPDELPGGGTAQQTGEEVRRGALRNRLRRGPGRRSFVVRLSPVRPARVRWVVIEAIADDPVQKTQKVLVRVGSG